MKIRTMQVCIICLLVIFASGGVAFASECGTPDVLSNDIEMEDANNALEELEEHFSSENELSNEQLSLAFELINCYKNDTMFAQHYKEDPEGAIDMVSGVINSMMSMDAISTEPERASVYVASGVPSHKQIQAYSCGAASALQVIVQQGGASNVSGSTYNAKEQTLINQTGLGAGTQTTVIVWEVAMLINNYSSAHSYAYIECTNMSQSTFNNMVRNSLIKNCPVILHAIKGYMDYYPSTDTGGHYIVGYAWKPSTGTFTVNDCHYSNLYTGVHTVQMVSAYNSVHAVSGRFLIYGY